MRNVLKVLVASLALAAAAPAVAQYVFKPALAAGEGEEGAGSRSCWSSPSQQFQRWNNVVRLNLGVTFFYSEYYNCSYWYGFYPTYTCGSGSWVSYVPFTVGPQVDINLERDEQHQRRLQRLPRERHGHRLLGRQRPERVEERDHLGADRRLRRQVRAPVQHGRPVPRGRRHVHRPERGARRRPSGSVAAPRSST